MAELLHKKIVIEPVTRIEGHAKISIQLNEDESVKEARFHVNEFRGFEKFCEGRLYTEMPTITPRICGICPVSHAIASVKACEQIEGLTPSVTGDQLRRLMHLGQLISSHALSFFHLSSPDFLLGFDADPSVRNIIGVAGRDPELAKGGIRLRKFGQEISERITGKKIHAMGIAPGGMLFPLSESNRLALLEWIPEVTRTVIKGLEIIRNYQETNAVFVSRFADFPSLFLGTVAPDGTHEVYNGRLRFTDSDGQIVLDQWEPENYLDYIAEHSVSYSYLTVPYYKPLGIEKGIFRVGPLARLNTASRMKTPLAQLEFEQFKKLNPGKAVTGTFYYHYARLIETLCAVEEAAQLLSDKGLTSLNIQQKGNWNYAKGVGCTEAPRGTLFHHYETDPGGKLLKVNLLIATSQNNAAMNRAVTAVAQQFLNPKAINEGMLNRVEAAIRCFDPCLSCSTHALGQMPMQVELVTAAGDVFQIMERN